MSSTRQSILCTLLFFFASCTRSGICDSLVCPQSSLVVDDGTGRPVCACAGEHTVCVAGDVKCITARDLDATTVSKHSELIRQAWPTIITPNMSSVLPFPNKLQGFRPTCTGCRCVAPCKEAVFVVGCGHSGTTFLTRIVGAHPEYSAIMAETGWFSTYGGTRVAFESFRKESVGCGRSGKRVLVEKTPKHILSLDKVVHNFPTAKILLIYRDGRDVALSLAKRFRYPLDNRFAVCMAAGRWITDNRAADPYLTDNRIHIIRYEHLIADPHGTADHIFRFLENKPAPAEVHRQFDQQANLTWGRLDPVLNEPKERPTGGPAAAVINKHLRNWQVNQPMYDARGKWATEMSDKQLTDLYECRGFVRLMETLGYLDSANKTQWFDRTKATGNQMSHRTVE